MLCKCKYYLRDKEGNLICSVCGKPVHSNQIEDKVEEQHEDKRIWPPESKRITKVVKRRQRK